MSESPDWAHALTLATRVATENPLGADPVPQTEAPTGPGNAQAPAGHAPVPGFDFADVRPHGGAGG